MTRIVPDTARGQLVALPFQQVDVAASQTDAALGIDDANVTDYQMPWGGEVVAVSVRVNDARTAGAADVEPTKNGTALGFQADIDATNTLADYTLNKRENDRFVKGDRIGCNLTTDGSYAPVTGDLVAIVWVLVYLEGI